MFKIRSKVVLNFVLYVLVVDYVETGPISVF